MQEFHLIHARAFNVSLITNAYFVRIVEIKHMKYIN